MKLSQILAEKDDIVENIEYAPRYVIRNAAFALLPKPPIEWIIERMISEASVSLFYGEPGSKKTYSLLSLAVCVALGRNWLGFKVNQCNVLFIDEESGEQRLTLRLAAVLCGGSSDENTPLSFISLAGFKLDNKDDVNEIQRLIEVLSIGLVIIDALADVMDGDENSKQDIQPVFTALRRLAEKTRSAIIVVHHANKSGGYRGSTAIKGALDLMVKIESKDGSHIISFTSEKTRDIDSVKIAAMATWTEDTFYLSPLESTNKPRSMSKSQEFVLCYLEEHGPSSLPDIMGGAEICSPESARQAVYSLVNQNMVYRSNPEDKGRGVVAVYALQKEDDAKNSEF